MQSIIKLNIFCSYLYIDACYFIFWGKKRFPLNLGLRNQWIKAVKRENWTPGKFTRICSEHFHQDDIIRKSARVRIKENAVPSIFKAFPSYLQKVILFFFFN